jgi:hypothetical protein
MFKLNFRLIRNEFSGKQNHNKRTAQACKAATTLLYERHLQCYRALGADSFRFLSNITQSRVNTLKYSIRFEFAFKNEMKESNDF